VIEVSCGEYGDNIRKLVTAIQNGKHDIRTGKPFPELPPPEVLNNAGVKVTNGNGILGANAVENEDGAGVKYSDSLNLYQPHVTKYVTKEEQGKLKCVYHTPECILRIIYSEKVLSLIINYNYTLGLLSVLSNLFCAIEFIESVG
jgi:hypothetical protein